MTARKMVLASEAVKQFQELIAKHGDLPVMYAIPDVGTFDIDPPRFDSDGEGDDCFVV